MQPLLHPRTKAQLDLYIKNPSHALILHGTEGVGKFYLANWLADTIEAAKTVVEKDEKLSSISIDQIRGLYAQTQSGRNQVVIVKDAELLGREAQNAFLKLLEEPPKNTRFILATSSLETLLPTIRSRSQAILVNPPNKSEVEAYFTQYFTDENYHQLLGIVNHLPGELGKTRNNEELKQALFQLMQEAKEFYSGTPYQRHLICIEHNYERSWALNFLQCLLTITRALVSLRSDDKKTLAALTKQMRLLTLTQENLKTTPGNPKIHLTKLAQQL